MWWKKLHLSQKFSIFMGVFLLGVASGRLFDINVRILVYATFFLFILILFLGKNFLWLIFLFIFFFLSNFYLYWRTSSDLSVYYDKKVQIQGIIVKDVENNGLDQKIVLRLSKICFVDGRCQFVSQRILLTVPLYPQYSYGQVLCMEGKLTWPEGNYGHYLISQGIFALMYNPKKIEIINSDQGGFFWSKLYQVKYFILHRLNMILPAPHSSFMAALLLGIRQGMPASVNEDFRRAGISHIVAVSGYNISLLGNFSLMILPYFRLRKQYALTVSIFLIVLFVLLTGASASVVRAGVMGILLILARLFQQPGNIFNVLLLTACLMTLYNPGILLGDMGFQLSFLATIALIYFLPVLKFHAFFYKEDSWWQENFFTTVAATVITLPLILYNFGIFSVLAVPVNLLVLPLIPYLMMFGFFVFLMSLFSLFLANVCAVLVYGLLQLVLSLARFVSTWTWSILEVNSYNLALLFLFYLIFFIIIIWFHKKNQNYEKFL